MCDICVTKDVIQSLCDLYPDMGELGLQTSHHFSCGVLHSFLDVLSVKSRLHQSDLLLESTISGIEPGVDLNELPALTTPL